MKRPPVAGEGAEPSREEDQLNADPDFISPGYFQTLGIRLLDGRDFDERDAGHSPRVVIINRMLAERLWPGPDYEKIAPRSLREEPEELVDSLVFRFFQAPPGDKERGAFLEYARSKKGAIFTNKEIGELCHLMLSTPRYQLD